MNLHQSHKNCGDIYWNQFRSFSKFAGFLLLLMLHVDVNAAPPAGFNATACATENNTCAFTGTRQVAYGANTSYTIKTLTGGTPCTNGVFGDPIQGVVKACYLNVLSSSSSSLIPSSSSSSLIASSSSSSLIPSSSSSNSSSSSSNSSSSFSAGSAPAQAPLFLTSNAKPHVALVLSIDQELSKKAYSD